MNELYLTCETNNCPRRAEPGRRYCLVCSHTAETTFRLARVRIPANMQAAMAILGSILAADSVIEMMRQNYSRIALGQAKRHHVGWWCRACKSWAADLMRPCKCTSTIEDANRYYRFKFLNWRACYVEE